MSGKELQRDKERRRRWLLAGLLVAGVVIPTGTMLAANVTVPNPSFQSGTTIQSSQVNANFAALTTEATRVSNIVQGPGDLTNTNKVSGLAAPIGVNDAANKGYVDAAGNAGGGSMTLIGTTTCPSGWTVAMVGSPWFWNGANTVPHSDYACFGAGMRDNGSTLTGTGNVGLPWVENAYSGNTGTCVICVK